MPFEFDTLQADGTLQDYKIFRRGNLSSVDEAAELRAGKGSQLNNPAFRLRCIGYFYGQSSSEDVRLWLENVEWYIKNHNLDYMAGKIPIHRICTASQFRHLRQIWLETVDSPHSPEQAIANAGEFIGNRDFETAVILLKRAIYIDRENLEFYRVLRSIFMRESELCHGQRKEDLLDITFEVGECTLKIARSQHNSAEFLDLQKLFDFALKNCRLEEAKAFIYEIQNIVETRPYWRTTFYLRLGRLFLKESELQKGKDCLLKASKLGTSHNLTLGQELIEMGEGLFVAKCLKLMIKNAPEAPHVPLMNDWIAELLRGGSPILNTRPTAHLKVG